MNQVKQCVNHGMIIMFVKVLAKQVTAFETIPVIYGHENEFLKKSALIWLTLIKCRWTYGGFFESNANNGDRTSFLSNVQEYV